MIDPIVDEPRRVREELIKRYGGIDGYFRHLQEMDRVRLRAARKRAAKLPVKSRTNDRRVSG